MMQIPITNFAVTVILLICLGFLIAELAFALAADGEEKRTKERQAYLDALLQLGNGGLDARRDLISSALESMEDEKRR